eukprot:4246305-Prymnesium_polylepis.1
MGFASRSPPCSPSSRVECFDTAERVCASCPFCELVLRRRALCPLACVCGCSIWGLLCVSAP